MKLKLTAALIALCFASVLTARNLDDLKKQKGFVQKLEKGKIPALTNPEYVTADEAEIPDKDFVIGVFHNGEARAYSLNVLSNFSVVNDTIAGKSVLIVWDPLANVLKAYDRKVNGNDHSFIASGALYHGAMVLYDNESESYWAGINGSALAGSAMGTTLTALPIVTKTTFGQWKGAYPETSVLAIQGNTYTANNPYAAMLKNPQPISKPAKIVNKAVPPKAFTYSFNHGGKDYAILHNGVMGGWKGKAGKENVFVYRDNPHPYMSTRAWALGKIKLKKKGNQWVDKANGTLNPATGVFDKSGMALQPLNGTDTYWWVASNYNTKVKMLNPPRRGFSEFDKPVAGRITGADDPTKRN